MEKLYKVQMNSKGMPNFSTAEEIADRSQGEWIDKGNWMGIECSRCKCHSRYITPFCPHCGARMKGADDEVLRQL